MPAGGSADAAPHPMTEVYAETWTILEMHFLTRPHLMAEARERLIRCLDRLRAEGLSEPRQLKDIACRTIQLEYGPAPAAAGPPPAARPVPSPRRSRYGRALPHHAPSASLFASAR